MRRVVSALSLILTFAAPLTADAAPTLVRDVIGCAGGSAAMGPYALRATAGEPIVGTLEGGGFRLRSGFWAPVGDVIVSAEGPQPPHLQTILRGASPNPFNPSTHITFEIGSDAPTLSRLDVFDVSGRRVRRLVDGARAAGRYHVTWDGLDDTGRPMASGIYLCRLHAGSHRSTVRLVLVK